MTDEGAAARQDRRVAGSVLGCARLLSRCRPRGPPLLGPALSADTSAEPAATPWTLSRFLLAGRGAVDAVALGAGAGVTSSGSIGGRVDTGASVG